MKSERYSDRAKVWIIKNAIEKELSRRGAPFSSVLRYGSEILVFTPDINYYIQNRQLVRRLAQKYRIRIKIRATEDKRIDQEQAIRKLRQLLPNTEISAYWFDNCLGELHVEVPSPQYEQLLRAPALDQFFAETGWKVVLHRKPLLESSTVRTLYRFYDVYQEELYKIRKKVGDIIRKPVSRQGKLWVRLIALGGYKEVGRSCHVIQTPNNLVIVDLGVNVGSFVPQEEKYPYIEALGVLLHYSTSAVIITHAHLDHIGFLPYIYRAGCEVPIYTTEPTRDLMYLLLLDYVDVCEKSGVQPMYDKDDIKKMLKYVIPVRYGEVHDVAPDVRATFYNAGHILGSALVHLHVGEGDYNLVIANDFKLSGTPILGKAYTKIQYVNGIIIEATYGGKQDIQESRDEAEKRLIGAIKETIEEGGKVLIPVFAVGRAQEIMYTLVQHREELENVRIYIDGMVKEATAIYTKYPEYLDPAVAEKIRKGENPFIDDRFVFVSSQEEREELAANNEACVIIASSGMLVGGPSLEYFLRLCESEKNKIIFVGYQAVGTLGRKLIDGERKIPITLGEKRIIKEVKMKVEQIKGFSGHSDRRELLRFIKNFEGKAEKVIIAHGEPQKVEELAAAIKKRKKFKVYTPENLEAVRLR
ncbi:MAG: beta-CASP ribonuclease aCPSF1 [bacterium]|nr:beta-CASP ribonuclease aCPSF1 [bacterium]